MNEEVDRRVAAALRAQASAMGGPALAPARGRHRDGVPAWVVLALAVLLGVMAGGLAGAVSTW
ncbi:MAG: hypothetical protein ACRDS1_00665 [Pseudonocardiaceae bacterium]